MTVKINTLEVENVKRIRALQMTPSPNGLTLIGGKNAQGKTSVLDAIMYALGGERNRPSALQRDGSVADPAIRITLSNGIIVERSGKNASLKVIDPDGNRGGQTLLNSFVSQLALNLPAFLNATNREKADTLLQVIGVGKQLYELDKREEKTYNQRHDVGVLATRKKKHAEDLPFEPDAPTQEVSALELIQRQQTILAKNGENQRLRQSRDKLEFESHQVGRQIEELRQKLSELVQLESILDAKYQEACKTAEEIQDESTTEIEASLSQIDDINRRVRINKTKTEAEAEAAILQVEYDDLTEKINEIRTERQKLLDGANLPLAGLSVIEGELIYNGQKWDCMSSSEQLRVAVAIVRKLQPECGFVLLDKTEQMDTDTLHDFGQWLESEGLQVIATRVSTGDECSIIIEDGLALGQELNLSTTITNTDEEEF